jgi:hypothetical protein
MLDEAWAARAEAEEVAPLLGARVIAGELDATAVARARLVRAWRATVAASLLAEQSARPLIAALRARGIPMLLLKGAALVRVLYADPGRRSMADLDLLVPAARWREAITAARQLGWHALADEHRPVTSRSDYVRALARPDAINVEIHRGLSARSQFAIDYDALFARARPDRDGLLLADETDQFLSLAVHAAKHAFVLPLRSFLDGILLIDAARLDPDAVAARATVWGARRATAAWLRALDDLTPLPAVWRRAPGRAFLDEDDPTPGSWRFQRRVVGLIDGPARRAAWLAERTALRLADAVVAPLIGRSTRPCVE